MKTDLLVPEGTAAISPRRQPWGHNHETPESPGRGDSDSSSHAVAPTGAYGSWTPMLPRLTPWANHFRPSRGCPNLRTTRDLLLPKLISGNLNVEDFDVGLPGTFVWESTRRHKNETLPSRQRACRIGSAAKVLDLLELPQAAPSHKESDLIVVGEYPESCDEHRQ